MHVASPFIYNYTLHAGVMHVTTYNIICCQLSACTTSQLVEITNTSETSDVWRRPYAYVGHVATWTCVNYNIRWSGDAERTCLLNNTWSGVPIVCSPGDHLRHRNINITNHCIVCSDILHAQRYVYIYIN